MSDASVLEVMQAIASQLEEQLASDDALQVGTMMILNPTPPTLDVYPGDPFGEAISFDDGNEQLFTIRARVSSGSSDAGQELLLTLMDNRLGSVIAAIRADRTLDGTVDDSVIEGPSGYIPYADTSGAATGSLLGCEWRLRALR